MDTIIVAIRHGETAWNVDSRLQGHLDIPLNDVGLAAPAGPPGLPSNPSTPSTAVTCNAPGSDPHPPKPQAPLTHQGLRERSFGVLPTFAESWKPKARTNLPLAQARPRLCAEGGESLIALRDAHHRTTTRPGNPAHGRQIVLVAHGGVLDVLYRLGYHARTFRPAHLAAGQCRHQPPAVDARTASAWWAGQTQHLDNAVRDENHA